MGNPFAKDVRPDWEGLVASILRKGSPSRVHTIELFLDFEIAEAVAERYGLLNDLDRDDLYYMEKREIAVQSFLGYDYVRCGFTGSPSALPVTHRRSSTISRCVRQRESPCDGPCPGGSP